MLTSAEERDQRGRGWPFGQLWHLTVLSTLSLAAWSSRMCYERGSARRSSVTGRMRAIVSQTNTGTCNVGETSVKRGGVYNYGLFRAHRYQLELNWINDVSRVLNWKYSQRSIFKQNSPFLVFILTSFSFRLRKDVLKRLIMFYSKFEDFILTSPTRYIKHALHIFVSLL